MKTSIKFRAQKGSHSIEGAVIFLHHNDIRVMITRPYDGISAGYHELPGLRSGVEGGFLQQGKLTKQGKLRALKLLSSLYESCRFFEENRVELASHFEPFRPKLEQLTQSIRNFSIELASKKRGDIHSNLQSQQKSIRLVSELYRQYYEESVKRYEICQKIGLDTFIQLTTKYLSGPPSLDAR